MLDLLKSIFSVSTLLSPEGRIALADKVAFSLSFNTPSYKGEAAVGSVPSKV